MDGMIQIPHLFILKKGDDLANRDCCEPISLYLVV